MQPILRVVIAVMIFGGAASIPLLYAGPQLFRDMRTASWIAAPSLATKASSCTHWSRVVSTCSIDYFDRFEPEHLRPQLRYFILGSWDGERGTLMKSSDDPDHVTVTLGIEHMAARQYTFAIWSALTLGIAVLILLFGVRTLRLGATQEDF
jgi:hypothetical protein